MSNAVQGQGEVGSRRRPPFELHDRLRKARELTGMEKQDFAEMLGIHRDSVANYETGRRHPRRPVLIAWALAAGVDLDWLTGDEGDGGWAPWGSNPRPADYKGVGSPGNRITFVDFRKQPERTAS